MSYTLFSFLSIKHISMRILAFHPHMLNTAFPRLEMSSANCLLLQLQQREMYHLAQSFSVTLEYYLHTLSGFARESCQLHSEGRDFIIVTIKVVKTLQILNGNYSASSFKVCLLISIAHVLSLLTNWKKKM